MLHRLVLFFYVKERHSNQDKSDHGSAAYVDFGEGFKVLGFRVHSYYFYAQIWLSLTNDGMELSESFSFFYVGLKDSNLELGSPNPRSTQTHDLRQKNS